MKPVLLLTVFATLCTFGNCFMLTSTCDTIKNQLALIDDTIHETTRFNSFPSSNTYTAATTSTRLEHLLKQFDDSIRRSEEYWRSMHSLVQEKLTTFSIPAVGMLNDAEQLEKVFQHVNERNLFFKKDLEERQVNNENMKSEIGQLETEVTNLQKTVREIQIEVGQRNKTIADAENDKKKLQAKINDNPITIQG